MIRTLLAWLRELRAWAREEMRLMRLDTWADEYDRPRAAVGTMEDPAVASMFLKMRRHAKKLHDQRKTLLAGKEYTPETIVVNPPRAHHVRIESNIYPFRKRG